MTAHGDDQHPAASGRPAGLADPARPASAAPGPAGPSGLADPRVRRLAGWFLFVLAGLVLWFCYLRLSRTQAVDADGAAQALQAWDMLHGNLLLRGWWLSDVSFYTTELPEYMLVESVRGLNADVMHVAASLTYTLLVLFAALLARGQATGRQAVIRMLLAAGIVLAPQLGAGTFVLLLNPDHTGSSVVMMAILLVLDRAPRRWWVPVLAGVLLAWVLVADTIVLYTGVIPLVLVCGVRVYQEVARRRKPVAGVYFEIALAAAAVAAVLVAMVATALIHARGGYYVWTASPRPVPLGELSHNLRLGLEGLALLFGCDFAGVHGVISTVLAVLHLAGAALAAWAVALGVRRFFSEASLVTRVLTAAVLINIAGYVFSTSALTLLNAREMAAVLPFSAVLAGRLLADRLTAARLARVLVPVLAVALLGYGLALVYDAAQPPVPAQHTDLTAWLARHHYDYGLAGYWYSNGVTLISGERVQVRPVCYGRGRFTSDRWEARTSWYDPGLHRADFLVMNPSGGYGGLHSVSDGGWAACYPPSYQQVVAAFGRPAHIYHVGPDKVLVWDQNLLARLG
jgi:hypothetical protein